jgi:hypothetical protein
LLRLQADVRGVPVAARERRARQEEAPQAVGPRPAVRASAPGPGRRRAGAHPGRGTWDRPPGAVRRRRRATRGGAGPSTSRRGPTGRRRRCGDVSWGRV